MDVIICDGDALYNVNQILLANASYLTLYNVEC